MPRIDEALARARTYRPDPSEPAAAATASPTDFPIEAEEPGVVPPAAPVLPAPTAGDRAGGSTFDSAPIADLTDVGPGEDGSSPAMAERLLSSRKMTSVEQYRRLAARLYLAQAEDRCRVVMVTSAMPGEGKTLTAANLALTLSESYRRQVLLVDADLRRPCLHELFQVPNVTGLNEGLRAAADRKVPVIRVTDHLTLLTAGRPEPDPMSVLASDRMRRVLEEAAAAYEWVIVDTPPIGLLSDARLVASLVETVLLVVRAGSTSTSAISSAIEAIGRERILGVVLNRADQALPHAEYAYQYYASPQAGE